MNDLEQRLSTALRTMSEQAPSAAGLETKARRRHHRRQRSRFAAAAVVVVAALPLGAQLLDGPSRLAPAPSPAVTPSPSESPDASQAPDRAYVGDTRLSDLGEITVHDVQFPLEVSGKTPPPGERFGALDLEVCSSGKAAGTDGPPRYSLEDFMVIERWIGSPQNGPAYFPLAANRSPKDVREPALSEAQVAGVAQGSCARGWVSFTLPRGTEIGTVAYQPWRATPLMWRVRR